MKTSESIKEIAIALHKAQGHMTGAKKDSKNPFFKSSYSDLTAVMQAISKPFHDNGLSFVQGAEYQDSMIAIVTRIMHISGEWIESTTQLPAVKNDPQSYGSAVTYGKRYGLQALAGVPSVDDDGQYASAGVAEINQKEDGVRKETLNQINDCIVNNDRVVLKEIWHEMDRPEQGIIWGMLRSDEQATVKTLLDKKEAA